MPQVRDYKFKVSPSQRKWQQNLNCIYSILSAKVNEKRKKEERREGGKEGTIFCTENLIFKNEKYFKWKNKRKKRILDKTSRAGGDFALKQIFRVNFAFITCVFPNTTIHHRYSLTGSKFIFSSYSCAQFEALHRGGCRAQTSCPFLLPLPSLTR